MDNKININKYKLLLENIKQEVLNLCSKQRINVYVLAYWKNYFREYSMGK